MEKINKEKIDKLKELKDSTSNERLKESLKQKIEVIKQGGICTK